MADTPLPHGTSYYPCCSRDAGWVKGTHSNKIGEIVQRNLCFALTDGSMDCYDDHWTYHCL